MTFIAILATFAAIYLVQDSGAITISLVKRLLSTALLIISGIVLSIDYGTLRGVFILLALVSLLGTLFTLLRYKGMSAILD